MLWQGHSHRCLNTQICCMHWPDPGAWNSSVQVSCTNCKHKIVTFQERLGGCAAAGPSDGQHPHRCRQRRCWPDRWHWRERAGVRTGGALRRAARHRVHSRHKQQRHPVRPHFVVHVQNDGRMGKIETKTAKEHSVGVPACICTFGLSVTQRACMRRTQLLLC